MSLRVAHKDTEVQRTCSTSQNVTQKRVLLLRDNSSEVRKPKNGCILQENEQEKLRCLEYQVASERFLAHVSIRHKESHCWQPGGKESCFSNHRFPHIL